MTPAQRDMIDYTLASVAIDVNSAQGWVELRDLTDPTATVFLQGDDASAFISEARAFYNDDGHVSMDEAYALFAYPYLDLLTN